MASDGRDAGGRCEARESARGRAKAKPRSSSAAAPSTTGAPDHLCATTSRAQVQRCSLKGRLFGPRSALTPFPCAAGCARLTRGALNAEEPFFLKKGDQGGSLLSAPGVAPAD